jgi:hypothetical protein
LELFDRVHDYGIGSDPADNRAYESRQIRRSRIMAEIERLSASKSEHRNHVRISRAVVFLCAIGYATLRYLLR